VIVTAGPRAVDVPLAQLAWTVSDMPCAGGGRWPAGDSGVGTPLTSQVTGRATPEAGSVQRAETAIVRPGASVWLVTGPRTVSVGGAGSGTHALSWLDQ